MCLIAQAALLYTLFIQAVYAHKCYVCLPDKGRPEEVSQLKRQFSKTKISLCSQYKTSLRDSYLLTCPDGSNGCLTMFDDDGSVIRTCAPIQFDECKKANSVNYCYCSNQGCNSPESRLPATSGDSSAATQGGAHRHGGGGIESMQFGPNRTSVVGGGGSMRPRQGHELDFSAPRIQQTQRIVDDEDIMMVEGSSDDWESHFYYDQYYDTAGDMPGGRIWSDDEDLESSGFGADGGFDDMVDMTEPPPFIQAELEEELEKIRQMKPNHKFDRGNGGAGHGGGRVNEPDNEIVFEETTTTRVQPSAGSRLLTIDLFVWVSASLGWLLARRLNSS